MSSLQLLRLDRSPESSSADYYPPSRTMTEKREQRTNTTPPAIAAESSSAAFYPNNSNNREFVHSSGYYGITTSTSISRRIFQQQKDTLKTRLAQRPSRQKLYTQHILLSASPVDPLVESRIALLKRNRLVDDLNRRLKRRPGPLELVTKRILQVDAELEQALQEGQLPLRSGVQSQRRPNIVANRGFTTANSAPPALLQGSGSHSSSRYPGSSLMQLQKRVSAMVVSPQRRRLDKIIQGNGNTAPTPGEDEETGRKRGPSNDHLVHSDFNIAVPAHPCTTKVHSIHSNRLRCGKEQRSERMPNPRPSPLSNGANLEAGVNRQTSQQPPLKMRIQRASEVSTPAKPRLQKLAHSQQDAMQSSLSVHSIDSSTGLSAGRDSLASLDDDEAVSPSLDDVIPYYGAEFDAAAQPPESEGPQGVVGQPSIVEKTPAASAAESNYERMLREQQILLHWQDEHTGAISSNGYSAHPPHSSQDYGVGGHAGSLALMGFGVESEGDEDEAMQETPPCFLSEEVDEEVENGEDGNDEENDENEVSNTAEEEASETLSTAYPCIEVGPKKQQGQSNRVAEEAATTTRVISALSDLKMKELKQECRRRNLIMTGSKQQIAERLSEWESEIVGAYRRAIEALPRPQQRSSRPSGGPTATKSGSKRGAGGQAARADLAAVVEKQLGHGKQPLSLSDTPIRDVLNQYMAINSHHQQRGAPGGNIRSSERRERMLPNGRHSQAQQQRPHDVFSKEIEPSLALHSDTLPNYPRECDADQSLHCYDNSKPHSGQLPGAEHINNCSSSVLAQLHSGDSSNVNHQLHGNPESALPSTFCFAQMGSGGEFTLAEDGGGAAGGKPSDYGAWQSAAAPLIDAPLLDKCRECRVGGQQLAQPSPTLKSLNLMVPGMHGYQQPQQHNQPYPAAQHASQHDALLRRRHSYGHNNVAGGKLLPVEEFHPSNSPATLTHAAAIHQQQHGHIGQLENAQCSTSALPPLPAAAVPFDPNSILTATSLAKHEDELHFQQRKIHEVQMAIAKSQQLLRQQQNVLYLAKRAQQARRDAITGRQMSHAEYWLSRLDTHRLGGSLAHNISQLGAQRKVLGTQLDEHQGLLAAEQRLQNELHVDQAVEDIVRLIQQDNGAALLIVSLLRKYQLEQGTPRSNRPLGTLIGQQGNVPMQGEVLDASADAGEMVSTSSVEPRSVQLTIATPHHQQSGGALSSSSTSSSLSSASRMITPGSSSALKQSGGKFSLKQRKALSKKNHSSTSRRNSTPQSNGKAGSKKSLPSGSAKLGTLKRGKALSSAEEGLPRAHLRKHIAHTGDRSECKNGGDRDGQALAKDDDESGMVVEESGEEEEGVQSGEDEEEAYGQSVDMDEIFRSVIEKRGSATVGLKLAATISTNAKVAEPLGAGNRAKPRTAEALNMQKRRKGRGFADKCPVAHRNQFTKTGSSYLTHNGVGRGEGIMAPASTLGSAAMDAELDFHSMEDGAASLIDSNFGFSHSACDMLAEGGPLSTPSFNSSGNAAGMSFQPMLGRGDIHQMPAYDCHSFDDLMDVLKDDQERSILNRQIGRSAPHSNNSESNSSMLASYGVEMDQHSREQLVNFLTSDDTDDSVHVLGAGGWANHLASPATAAAQQGTSHNINSTFYRHNTMPLLNTPAPTTTTTTPAAAILIRERGQQAPPPALFHNPSASLLVSSHQSHQIPLPQFPAGSGSAYGKGLLHHHHHQQPFGTAMMEDEEMEWNLDSLLLPPEGHHHSSISNPVFAGMQTPSPVPSRIEMNAFV